VLTAKQEEAPGDEPVSRPFQFVFPSSFCLIAPGALVLITDAQLKAILDIDQNDRRVNVMRAPKVTAFNGQEVTLKITQQEAFVTGLEAQREQGQTLLVPKITTIETGTTITLRGQASADKKFVSVNVGYNNTRVDGNVEKIPVVTQVPAVPKDGKSGKPIALTQYLQIPQVETLKIEKSDLKLASGGHVVIAGPTFVHELSARDQVRVASMSRIPYVNRLFAITRHQRRVAR
jgi:type II secretory pathway component GspD/PulD (secretin)